MSKTFELDIEDSTLSLAISFLSALKDGKALPGGQARRCSTILLSKLAKMKPCCCPKSCTTKTPAKKAAAKKSPAKKPVKKPSPKK